MSEIRKIVAFLHSRYDEEAWWAREASRSGKNYTATGEHWKWETSSDDEPITPDPVNEEHLGDSLRNCAVGLRSVEEYSDDWLGPGRTLCHVIFGAEEVPSAVGGHIIRHDPARVLRDVEAKREILERHERRSGDRQCQSCWPMRCDVYIMARPYRDHPEFQAQWVRSA